MTVEENEAIYHTLTYPEQFVKELIALAEYPDIEIKRYDNCFGGHIYRGELTTATGQLLVSEYKVDIMNCCLDEIVRKAEQTILYELGYKFLERAMKARAAGEIATTKHIYTYRKILENYHPYIESFKPS